MAYHPINCWAQVKIQITKSEAEKDPDAKLWAIIFYLAENNKTDISQDFRYIWLVHIYNAEVSNGGHLQYFHNQGSKNIPDTITALILIGANKHAEILAQCWKRIKCGSIEMVKSLSEYADLQKEINFVDDDKRFYSLQPDTFYLLGKYYSKTIERTVTICA